MEEILSGFKPVFSRVSGYAWYVVVVIGLMIRSDRLGLTSICTNLKNRTSEADAVFFVFPRKNEEL